MFCQLCGARNDEPAEFCHSCGHKLRTEEAVPAVPYRPSSPYAPPRTSAAPVYHPDDQAYRPHVESHLGWSVLSTLLCCLPIGVVAIYHSLQVGRRLGEGDLEGAEHASQLARRWATGALIAGIVLSVGTFFLSILSFVLGL